ncbi:Arv1-like family-domain-containing protein [Phyllosticta capitalensis]|uniref:Arv1-like family-domain-containing protein n=1 Tax=Phyllosticta capitalensis TaxID=121624 RepID=UPI003131CBD7
MPICIECRYPLRTLYTTYSKADDRALGKGVRLTQCPRCKRFGDKYVEHDFVVLFIDLVLIKPQPSIIRLGILLLLFDVYLTWARIEKASPSSSSSPLDPSSNPSSLNTSSSSNSPQNQQNQQPPFLSTQPLVLQYMFFLGLCTAQTLAFHLPIRFLCMHPPRLWLPGFCARWGSSGEDLGVAGVGHGGGSGGGGGGGALMLPPATVAALAGAASGGTTTTTTTAHATTSGGGNGAGGAGRGSRTPSASLPPSGTTTPHTLPSPPHPKYIPLIPHHPFPTPISTALLVSSCTKLFPLLLIIWDYDLPSSASAVSWAVIVNNIAALEILMDCGYLRAGLLVGVAAAVRAVVGSAVLGSVGEIFHVAATSMYTV